MKNSFVKKVLSAVLGTAVISASFAPAVFADSAELLNQTAAQIDSWTYASSSKNAVEKAEYFTNDGEYIWTTTPITKNQNHGYVVKEFEPISDGETLEINAEISVNQIKYGADTKIMLYPQTDENYNDEKVTNDGFTLFRRYQTPWQSPAAQTTVLSNKGRIDTNAYHRNGADLDDGTVISEGDMNCTGTGTMNVVFSPNVENSNYIASINLNIAGTEYTAQSELTKEKALSLSRIYLYASTNDGYTASSANNSKLLGVKSVSITKSAGAINFGSPYIIGEATKINHGFDKLNFSSLESNGWTYANGGNNALEKNQFFADDSGYLWATSPASNNNAYGYIGHSFEPISAGETLTIEADINADKNAWATDSKIMLSSTENAMEENTSLTLLRRYHTPNGNGVTTALSNKGRINTNAWHTNGGDLDNGTALTSDENALTGSGKMMVTLTPISGTENYNAAFKLIVGGETYTAETTVTQTKATNFRYIYLYSCVNESYTAGTAKKLLGISSLKIYSYGRTTELSGSNDNVVYIPYTNTTGRTQNFAVCAAVCAKDGEVQKRFYADANSYKNYSKYSSELGINVGKIDSSEYVRLFVFDDFQTLTPLTTSKDIGK